MTTHGNCSECGFVIECIDPFGCDRHDFLGKHYDAKDCIRLLKEHISILESKLNHSQEDPFNVTFDRYDGEF